MYSRSVKVRADERYASNIPPVYGGSRFYRTPPGDGIAVQYEARSVPPVQTEERTAEPPCAPPLAEVSEPCEACDPCRAEEPPAEEICAENGQLSLARKEGHGNFLQSFIEGDKEELLLIAVLLLLCGEEERAGDMIAILLLLIILR